MLLGKGSSLAVGHGRGFIKLSALVESLGTALARTTLQAKPAWARGKAKQVPQCICDRIWENSPLCAQYDFSLEAFIVYLT